MVLKTDIEITYKEQQLSLLTDKIFINREYLTDFSITGKHVEIISGVRRCGKSTLLMQIMKKYYQNIAYFNFEDARIHGFDLNDFIKLDEIIGKSKDAYFFDEIQNVDEWEVFIRQLHERGEKIFITGSNASLLSKELGTRLTGRYISHELFPFSYIEYLMFNKFENTLQTFDQYIEEGGFPEYVSILNTEILQTLLKDIVLRDVAIRYGIKKTKSLMDITYFLTSNIGKEFSYNSLKKMFSVGSANSVSDYLTWLKDSYIFFYLPRFSWSLKSIAVNSKKVYAIDNGLINSNSLSFTKDKGRLLENTIFLFLRRKYESIFYFREKGECDFVVFDNKTCVLLLQVCEEVHNDNKFREINGLFEAMEFFKMDVGYIITKNQEDTIKQNDKTILLTPACQFLTT